MSHLKHPKLDPNTPKWMKEKLLKERFPSTQCESRGHLISCIIDSICTFAVMSPNKDVDSEYITDKDLRDLIKMNITYVLMKKWKGYQNIPKEELDCLNLHIEFFLNKVREEYKDYL